MVRNEIRGRTAPGGDNGCSTLMAGGEGNDRGRGRTEEQNEGNKSVKGGKKKKNLGRNPPSLNGGRRVVVMERWWIDEAWQSSRSCIAGSFRVLGRGTPAGIYSKKRPVAEGRRSIQRRGDKVLSPKKRGGKKLVPDLTRKRN